MFNLFENIKGFPLKAKCLRNTATYSKLWGGVPLIKIKTVQKIKSGIWEIKGGNYTKTLAKIPARRIFRIRNIRRNVLPKFIEICMEMSAGAHLDEYQQGGRKPIKTSVTEFWYKSVILFLEELINIKVILFLIT